MWVNLCNSKKSFGIGVECIYEVIGNRESINVGVIEGSGSRDNVFEFFVYVLFMVVSYNEILVFELFGNIVGVGVRNFNLGFGEDGVGGEYVGNVDEGVDGVKYGVFEVEGRRYVVDEIGDGGELWRVVFGFLDIEKMD